MLTDDPIEAPLARTFAALDIPWVVHRHPPLMTVAQSKALRGDIAGQHVKNLLVRDKKRTLWLVVVPEDLAVDLKALRGQLDTRGGLSFASADLLLETLGVTPGAVTPLAVMNDTDGRVTLVLDERLVTEPIVCCHPLHNAATVQLSGAELVRFATETAHPPLTLLVPHRTPDS